MLIWRPAARAGILGVADQVVLSVTNLIIGLLLARELDPILFGIYVVAFALLLIGSSVQLSIITDPLLILGPARPQDLQASYGAALMRIQCTVSTGLAIIGGLGAGALWLASAGTSQLAPALAGLSLALPFIQAQSFLRAVLFTRFRPGSVFFTDAVLSALRLVTLAALLFTESVTVFSVFVTYGLSALLSAAFSAYSCQELLRVQPEPLATVWHEHWKYGRWLLARSAAYWCSGQAPILLVSAVLSPLAAGVIKACTYLVTPLNVAFMGLEGLLVPRASILKTEFGGQALSRFLGRVAAGSCLAVCLYGAVTLPFSERLMSGLYREKYQGYSLIVAILLVDALLQALVRAPILRLKVYSDTRSVFLGYSFAAVAGFLALVSLAPTLGLVGAALAAPVSSATLLFYLTTTRSGAAFSPDVPAPAQEA
ncbi:MAG: lipopolysaccharide biosynthesis protein [Candidatus Polarisedimenticolia bacterium]